MQSETARPPAKWARRSEDRPGEIVAAALALFAERGFAATKLDDVAKVAGISKGTVYLYFKTKEDLFRAVVRHELVPVLTQFQDDSTTFAGSSGDLMRMILGRVSAVVDTDLGVIPKLVLAEAGNFPEIARFYADEVVARAFGVMDGILKRGAARGEFRPIDTASFLAIFIGPVLFTLLWRHSIGRHTDIRFDHHAVLDAHVDILLRGLSPGPTP